MWGQGPCGSAKPVVALGGGVVRCVACSAALASLPACLRLLWVTILHKKPHTFVWEMRSVGQQSPRTNEPAQDAPRTRNQASASPTAAQDPRFKRPAGCRRAHTGQHTQLAASSHSWRAPAGRHSPTRSRGFRPLNLHPPPLQPAGPRPRVPTGSPVPSNSLQSCSRAACPPHLGPGSAAKIRHPAQIATADSVDLRQTHQAS